VSKIRPPKWADRFLEWYCRADRLEEIQGDAYELFERTVGNNKRRADLQFIWNVLRFFRWRNIRRKNNPYPSSQITLSMLKNFFITSWRNLVRKKVFTMINIFGLAIGLTCFMLIAAFVYDELSYDQYAREYKNIYRVGLQLQQNGGVDDYPHVDKAVGAGIKTDYPEVKEFTRLVGSLTDYIKNGDANIKEERLALADSNFLSMFSIPLVDGNVHDALTEPNSIVVSTAFAKKYLGDKPALGETLISQRYGVLKITGVFAKIPDNSHFHFDAFISTTSTAWFTTGRQTWSNVGTFTYILLNDHTDANHLERKLSALVEKHVVPEIQEDMGIGLAEAQRSVNSWKFYLMPLSKIHLHSATKYEIEANGDINTVYIFSALAVFILLLACINFMNLSTASSARRAMEIGIRKSMGSFRSQLVIQFLVESLTLSMIALGVAVTLALLLLPFFNQLTGKQIDISFFLSAPVLVVLLALGIAVGLLAGIYPAVFLSSFQTLRVLKSNSPAGTKRSGLRSTLVVFQFAISIALIVATIVAYQQLHFLQNIKMGYERDQVVVIENAWALRNNLNGFKNKLQSDHRIEQVTHATVPIGQASSFGGTEVTSKGDHATGTHMHVFSIDYNYIETMGLQLVHGRNISEDFPNDSLGRNVIINETAMNNLGWTENNVIGSTIIRSGTSQYQVVGVVKDFHYTSAKEKIAPMMMLYDRAAPSFLVKIKTTELETLISDLKTQWSALHVNVPFSYYFLDDRFEHLYKAEQTTEQIFIVFMVIAIVIASLGLYGLSTYSAEQRVKEIGIRKILGSSVSQIVFLQSKEFLVLVLVAIVVAAPFSWWVMDQWLQNFGYRVYINGWVILLAGFAAIIIALVTVSFQAIRAAMANPVKSLRAE
jgi:putative ABC transport system permease protein